MLTFVLSSSPFYYVIPLPNLKRPMCWLKCAICFPFLSCTCWNFARSYLFCLYYVDSTELSVSRQNQIISAWVPGGIVQGYWVLAFQPLPLPTSTLTHDPSGVPHTPAVLYSWGGVIEILRLQKTIRLTWILHAQSPVNHSSYIRHIFAAHVQTFLSTNDMWGSKSGWLRSACRHSIGLR